jgi:O-antigen/teichoic acid export membrane protein
VANESLLLSIGFVAFPALSRVQSDPPRLRAYFLSGYGLFVSLVMPIAGGCALFAENIVLVLLGSKWREATGIFRLLAPAILAFAFINPFAWFLLASNRAGRYVRISLVVTTMLIFGYVVAIGYGRSGMTVAMSATMLILALPVLIWARKGTRISMLDVFRVWEPARCP